MSARIRAVSLSGFKSFGERVRVEFLPGINAVIGPNGSGKSNVIEGIRWASHTARTRELRARAASELIFHGSSGRAAVGLAEVEVELEGLEEAHSLVISRRLYRDGESELQAAGRSVRVRDLHELLRGSGLGPGGLAVVGQGEVGAVVGADPATMLGYLEEAAGLSKATYRRAQTIERLESARQHLARAEDLVGEIAARVRQLEGEAASAREAAELRAEALRLERAAARHRARILREEIAKLGAEADRAEGDAAVAGERLAAATRQLDELRRERDAQHADLARLAAEEERLLGEARRHRERADSARRALEAAERERAGLRAEAAQLASVPAAVEVPEAPDSDVKALEQAANRASWEAMELQERLEAARKRLREEQKARETSAQEAAAARERQAAAQAQRAALQDQLAEAAAAGEELEGKLAGAVAAVEVAASSAQAASEALARAGESVANAERAARSASARSNEASAAAGPLERELNRLENTLANYARFGEGPRKALTSGLPGIIGAVGDLLRVPADLETAISAALGRRVEQVVVQDGGVAERIIDHLKRVGGRATFLPLDLLHPRGRRSGPIGREPGVLGFAADLVESDVNPVKEALLGDTLIVDTVGRAVALARRYRDRPRLVTLEGEIIEAGGAVTGGRGRAEGGGHLADTRRADELRAELAELRRVVDEGARERQAAQAQLQEASKALSQARAAESAARASLDAAQRERHSLEAALRSITQRRENLARRLEASGGPIETADPAPSAAPANVDELAATVADLEQALVGARESERTAAEAAREARSAHALHQERLRTLEQARARREQAATRLQAIEQRLNELKESDHANSRASMSEAGEASRLEGQARALDVATLRQELEESLERRRYLEGEVSRWTQVLSDKRQEAETARLARVRREASLEALLGEQGDSGEDEPDPEGTPRTWAQRLTAINTRLEAIGPVNPLAESDLLLERERLTTLEAGASDARGAAEELETALDELERDVTARLHVAIARVSHSFREYAHDLLGGEGELEVVRDESGLLEGLALKVQPKGKRTRSLHLLSAGERTMAALAFLFALAAASEGARGLPIAILDEVDAPLDEANIRRFTHFLRLLSSRGTQFILVTHQKATMEVADVLWGVTTDATGLSRTFSIRQESMAAD